MVLWSLAKEICVRVLIWQYTHWYGVWYAPALLLEVKGIFFMTLPICHPETVHLKAGRPFFEEIYAPMKDPFGPWLRVTWGCQTTQFFYESLWGQNILVVLHWKVTWQRTTRLLAIVWGESPSNVQERALHKRNEDSCSATSVLGRHEGFLLLRVSVLFPY